MDDKYVPLQSDVKRLISILEQEADSQNTITIYSHTDKHLPPNPICYHHPQSIPTLAKNGYFQTITISNGIDETAPLFKGPLFYEVLINPKKLSPRKNRLRQTPIKLPDNVLWDKQPNSCMLKFPDGKLFKYKNLKSNSAKYFCLLMEQHGLYVSHKTALKKIKINNIYGLIKPISDKIKNATLGKKIKLETKHEGSYRLLITS